MKRTAEQHRKFYATRFFAIFWARCARCGEYLALEFMWTNGRQFPAPWSPPRYDVCRSCARDREEASEIILGLIDKWRNQARPKAPPAPPPKKYPADRL